MEVSTDNPLDAFQKGYLVGKAEAYCEQVRTGAKLVGAFGFDRSYIRLVRETVKTEGCKLILDQTYSQDRATAYVYRYSFVRLLIKTLLTSRSDPATGAAIWTTGKLFGYSDYEIARYLEKHRVKTAL